MIYHTFHTILPHRCHANETNDHNSLLRFPEKKMGGKPLLAKLQNIFKIKHIQELQQGMEQDTATGNKYFDHTSEAFHPIINNQLSQDAHTGQTDHQLLSDVASQILNDVTARTAEITIHTPDRSNSPTKTVHGTVVADDVTQRTCQDLRNDDTSIKVL